MSDFGRLELEGVGWIVYMVVDFGAGVGSSLIGYYRQRKELVELGRMFGRFQYIGKGKRVGMAG